MRAVYVSVATILTLSLASLPLPATVTTAANGDLVISTNIANASVVINDINVIDSLRDVQNERKRLEGVLSAQEKGVSDLSKRLADSSSRICIIGGFAGGSEYLDSAVKSDGNAFASLPPLLQTCGGHAAVSYHGSVYVIGSLGERANPSGTTSVEMLERGFPWTHAPSLVTARADSAAVVHNDHIYAIGGYDYTNLLPISTVERFNGSAWSTAPALPDGGRHSHAAVVYRGSIHVIAGTGSSSTWLRTVQVFDGVSWSAGESLPAARTGHAAVVYQDRIYVIGGDDADKVVIGSVEMFDGSVWTSAPSLMKARISHTGVVFRDRIFVMGGFNGARMASVEIYDGVEWREAMPLESPISHHAAIVHTF